MIDYAKYLIDQIPYEGKKTTGNMPDEPDQCITGYMDGGERPVYFFGGDKLSKPYLKIKVRSPQYEDARQLAVLVIAALDGFHDSTVRGVLLREDGYSNGKDERDRSELTIQFSIII